MSKYTTEVRYICEHEAGYTESKGANDVDTVIANSWNKIFTTNCTFFDNDYRSILCSKILKHYYLREIGAEVVGIWKLWMNTKLEEIMPYYNQLYQSALLEFNPFNDVNYTKRHDGTNSGSSNVQGSKSGTHGVTSTDTKSGTDSSTFTGRTTDTGTVTDERDIVSSGTDSKTDRYSDTPQGTISNTDLEGNSYLTNVRMIGDTTHSTTADDNTETRNLAGTTNNTENITHSLTDNFTESNTISETNTTGTTTSSTDAYIEAIAGKMNTTPYSELLSKYREPFLNIDMMVIEEFDELFLGLW